MNDDALLDEHHPAFSLRLGVNGSIISHYILRQVDERRAEMRVCSSIPIFEDESVPETWVAIIDLDALPRATRSALLLSGSLENDELDLSPCEELTRMLAGLRNMVWSSQRTGAPTLH